MKTSQQGLPKHGEERPSNHCSNPHLIEVVALSRRQLLSSGVALGSLAFLGLKLPGLAMAQSGDIQPRRSRLPFKAVPASRADTICVPSGYQATPFIPWGTPITGQYPPFKPDATNTAAEQAHQVGSHHDGMHFFPIDAQRGLATSSDHGLLVLNHEYVDPVLLHPNGPSVADGKRTQADEIRKEMNAHGVSVVEIRRDSRGHWSVQPSARNRRITATTPMRIEGPARGHALMQTRYSPSGTTCRGTLNNCSGGHTPWGTFLTCEENWAGYFACSDEHPPRHLARYGLGATSRYGWETVAGDEFERFEATAGTTEPTRDYRNEPNTFGWIVEIDPFNPDSTPAKRTALGRFAHEGVVFAPAEAGQRLVCYSGDDAQNEYIYKYVSRDTYRNQEDGGRLLDDGTLYVARFNPDGTGEWLALDLADPVFVAACRRAGVTFSDQAEVLINTRTAADIAGATKMDRPEWGAINPETGDVYFSLTNNANRSEPNASNPRAPNSFGHIVRWHEQDGNPAGTRFEWNIYLLAGDGTTGQTNTGMPLDGSNLHASPDGLWFDSAGRLWIQTDMSGAQLESGPFGNNQMLVSDPRSGEIKRFLTAPVAAEVTGITATPDFRTLFVNIQHPGEGSTPDLYASHWPGGTGARPRSATVVINRKDGRPLL